VSILFYFYGRTGSRQMVTADSQFLNYPNNLDIAVVSDSAERSAVFAVRMVVFVEEQAVPPEEELDIYDVTATHFRVKDPTAQHLPESIVATARIVDKGHGVAKIGRVAVLQEFRSKGIGLALMRQVERHAASAGFTEAVLEAQCHAIPFYEKLGYMAEGGVFLDAGIEHRLMRRPL
jgi:predicted GNAT family N-acyltransferase